MRRWLAEGRPPTSDERRAVMRLPVLFARMTLVRWLLAVPLFALPNLDASREFALEEGGHDRCSPGSRPPPPST